MKTSDSDRMLDTFARAAGRLLHAPFAMVCLGERTGVYSGSDTRVAGVVPLEVERIQPLCERVRASRDVLVVGAAEDGADGADAPDAAPVESSLSFVGVPILGRDGKAVGCCVVADRRIRRWSEIDSSALLELVRIQRTEFEGTGTSLTAPVGRDADAAGPHDRFLSILETAAEGIYQLDSRGELVFVNSAAARMLGIAPVLHAAAAAGTAAQPRNLPGVSTLTSGERAEGSTVLVRSDGRELRVDYVATPLKENGSVAGAVVTFHDVSARRAGEERARRQEAMLAKAQHIAQLGSWERDVALNRVAWSDELYRIYGLSPGEFAATYDAYLQRVHPDDRTAVVAAIDTVLHTGRPMEFMERIVRPDGEIRHLRSRVEPQLGAEGEVVRLLGVCHDVTDRRAAEEQEHRLALSELAREQVTGILESISDAFFAVDSEWRFTYVNNEAETLLQRKREELLGRGLWDEFPDAVGSRFHREYARAVRERAAVEFEEFYPPLDAWLEVHAYPSVDGLSVYFRNVTRRRRTEEALRESEERFRSLVEATTAIVWSTSASGEFGGDQPGWRDFTGQTEEDYRGLGWLTMIHPDDRADTLASWRAAVENRSSYEAEHRLRRHDGEYRYMIARAIPILEQAGTVREWVGIHMDITRRKELEERQKFLVEAGALLASTLDYETTLRSVAALAVPSIADWCAIDLAGSNGVLRRVEVAHSDPEKRKLALELEQRFPSDPDAAVGAAHVFRTGEPELIPQITPEVLAAAARSEEHHAILRELGLRGYIAVPLVARGRILGVFTLVSAEGDRRLGDEDLETARELAARAALAVDNSRLFSELQAERSRLHDVLMQAPAAILITEGPDHTTLSANSLFRQLSGERDLVGRPIRDALPELARQRFLVVLDQVFAEREPFVGSEQAVLLDRSGSGVLEEAFFNVVHQPLTDASGVVYGTLTHAVEVTDQVRARREVERKAEELARLAAALERTNQELDQFAYVTSHDLKAPLRGIGNLAQWIEEDLAGDIPPGVKENLALLRGRVTRMEGLIEGILQYSRAGRQQGERELVDTGALVREVIEFLDPPESLTFVVEDGLPAFETEKLPLEQVLMNLIGNAIKHHDRPGGEVRVGMRESGGIPHFFVADDGPGIAPEYHDRIFGIFQTLEARDRVEGTGIGLSLVKKIVQTRGGRVWVESEEGKGATFRFSWPA
jgi:PAS domain S-box-containing protein